MRARRLSRALVGPVVLLAASVAAAQEGADPPPAETQEEAAAAAEEATPPAERAGLPPFDHALTSEEIDASLARLVETHPSLARTEPVGVSRGGRSIAALVLTDATRAPAGRKPALLVADHLDPAQGAGTETALSLAWSLASRFASDPEVARLLENVTIYVLPTLVPDRRAEDAAAEAAPPPVEFDRNFPARWRPEVLAPGAQTDFDLVGFTVATMG